MNRDIVYKFDQLRVGTLTINGECHVDFYSDGTWEIGMVFVETAYDSVGKEIDWPAARLQQPSIRDILRSNCRASIQSEVDEAIHWRND